MEQKVNEIILQHMNEIPDSFYSSTSKKLMRDPVMDFKGDSYDRSECIPSCVPNDALRSVIDIYLGSVAEKIQKEISSLGSMVSVDAECSAAPLDAESSVASVDAESSVASCFQIFVKSMTGKVIEVTINTTSLISDVKYVIFEKEGIPVDQQRLVFNGKQLEDKMSIGSYGISTSSIVHLILRLRGGMLDSTSGRDAFSTLRIDTPIHWIIQRMYELYKFEDDD